MRLFRRRQGRAAAPAPALTLGRFEAFLLLTRNDPLSGLPLMTAARANWILEIAREAGRYADEEVCVIRCGREYAVTGA